MRLWFIFLRGFLLNYKARFLSLFLLDKEFSIISDNCWGGYIYQHFNMEYKSPFIGLFIFSPCYIKLLENLEYLLASELVFISPEKSQYYPSLLDQGMVNKYPIALLGREVEIHFLHYKDREEALAKWSRRLAKVNMDKLIVKFCDRDHCTKELMTKFDNLDYESKCSFSSRDYDLKSNFKLKGEDGIYVHNEWKSFQRNFSPLFFLNKYLLTKK